MKFPQLPSSLKFSVINKLDSQKILLNESFQRHTKERQIYKKNSIKTSAFSASFLSSAFLQYSIKPFFAEYQISEKLFFPFFAQSGNFIF